MRAAGLSARKVEYLCDLAAALRLGRGARRRVAATWTTRPSSRSWSAIRGIGRWTAEMFLIFHLMRPNVLPLDDIGLIKGISVNYFSGEPVSRAEAREVGAAWAPFALSPLGIFGAASTRCRSPTDGPHNAQGETLANALPRFRAADRGARNEDRRAALCADRIGGRYLRRDRPAEQEEPAAHQGHLLRPDALAGDADRAPSAAARTRSTTSTRSSPTSWSCTATAHFADDLSIVGGLARFNGQACMVLGHQKGRDTKERAAAQLRHERVPRAIARRCA